MQIERSSAWHWHDTIPHCLTSSFFFALSFLSLSIHLVNNNCSRHETGNYNNVRDLICIVHGIRLQRKVRYIAGGVLRLRYGLYGVRWESGKAIVIRKCIIEFIIKFKLCNKYIIIISGN